MLIILNKTTFLILKWNIIFLILICSCSGLNEHEEYIKRWYNKTIIIPKDMSFFQYKKETGSYTLNKTKYKMLILLDTVSCITCQLKLDDWKRFMADIDCISQGNVSYLFAAHPLSKKELRIELQNENFNIPIYFDDRNLRKLNGIPFKGTHVFLLNQMNKVVCVGNPIVHRKLINIYKKIIYEK